MAQNWKKEAARRGYWYRKTKKVVHLQSIEITFLKHNVQLFQNNIQFYFEMVKENNKVQRNRDVFRDKYLDYIRKYNKVKLGKDKIKQERDSFRRENDAIKQENIAVKQVLKIYKQDNIEVKKENVKTKQEFINIKQENDELTKLLEPYRRQLMKMIKKYQDIKEANKELLYLLDPTLDTTYTLTSDEENIPEESDDERTELQEPRYVTNIPTRNVKELDKGTTTTTEKTPNLEIFPRTEIQKTSQGNETTSDESSINEFKRKKRMKKVKNTKKRKT